MTTSGDDARSARERMLAGELYLADDAELIARRRHASTLVAAYNETTAEDEDLRHHLLRELFGECGDGVEVLPPLHCDYGSQIRIGARTYANVGLVALDVAPITIGTDVLIGPNVQLITATHPLDPELRRAKWESGRPITVGDNVWLGAGVIVLPGVTIGDDAVVGAGAVVTKDVPSGAVAVGNPARVVRETPAG